MIKKKKYLSIIVVGLITTSFISCETIEYNDNTVVQPPVIEESLNNSLTTESISSIEQLNTAATLVLIKDLISWTNSFRIEIDGKKFGTISGQFVNVTGDKFTLKDKDDNTISSEKQIKRWGVKLNRLAEVYDATDNVVGYIGEEVINDFFNIGYTFHFYDKDKNEIGYCRQEKFNILDTFKVYDMDKKLTAEIKAQFSAIEDKYTITIHDNSIIPTDQVLYLAAILHSIKD